MNHEIINQINYHVDNFRSYFKDDYLFLPTASPKEIEKFENRFSIKIPDDFKWFLLNIANGIINTESHGFNVLDKINFSNYYYEDNEFNPSLPFRLNNEFNFNTDEYEDFINGTIHLAGYGCGCYSFIVVNGEEYGNVWIDNYSSNSEVTPEKNEKKDRLHFHDWLEKEINFMISQKEESKRLRQKQHQKEKEEARKYYLNMKNVSDANLPQPSLSVLERIKKIFK